MQRDVVAPMFQWRRIKSGYLRMLCRYEVWRRLHSPRAQINHWFPARRLTSAQNNETIGEIKHSDITLFISYNCWRACPTEPKIDGGSSILIHSWSCSIPLVKNKILLIRYSSILPYYLITLLSGPFTYHSNHMDLQKTCKITITCGIFPANASLFIRMYK